MTQARAYRYFEDVHAGDVIPSLRKDISLARMMAYGAATWDFIRIHYDTEYAREVGLPAPIVDGQMLGAYLAQLVQDWAGPKAFLCKLGFQNRRMVFPGDSISCHGQVSSTFEAEGRHLVECDLWIENQRGERVLKHASALVRFPSRKENND